MERIHIALAVGDLDDAIVDIGGRLGVAPCVVVPDAYALFRTTSVNLSLTVNTEQAGQLRHLGIEDSRAKAFVTESGPDGFIWERFTAEQQADEINTYWPQANYTPDKPCRFMERIHIALAFGDLDDAIVDIGGRLGVAPCVVVPDAYALFRTTSVNLSLTVNTEQAGQLRHLGIEDSRAKAFVTESGPDGFIWERFTAEQQADEINTYWPQANYTPDKP